MLSFLAARLCSSVKSPEALHEDITKERILKFLGGKTIHLIVESTGMVVLRVKNIHPYT